MPFETFHLSTDRDSDEKAQIDRDNAQMKKAIDEQKGRYIGPAPVAGWSIRQLGDGRQVWMKPDPKYPSNKVLIYDPLSGQRQLPQPGDGVTLGGFQGDLMSQLREKYSRDNGGGNPLTQQGWDVNPNLRHPNFANFGQLEAIDRFMSKYHNYNRPSQAQVDFYRQANNIGDIYRDIESKYAAMNGKAGLNKFMQWGQQFKTETDIANFGQWLLSGGPMGGKFAGAPDPERDAYLGIMRDILQLQRAGIDVTRLGAQAGISSQVVDAISQATKSIPWVGGALGSALDIGKAALKGAFDLDSVKTQVPYLKLVNDQAIHDGVYDGVHNGQIYWDDNTLRYANKAGAELNSNKIEPGDNLAEKAKPIPEPGEQQPPEQQPVVKKALPVGNTSNVQKPDPKNTVQGKVQSPSPNTDPNGAEKPTNLGVISKETGMSQDEVAARAQIVRNLEAQGKTNVYMDDPQVTKIYQQQKASGQKPAAQPYVGVGTEGPGITTPQPIGTTTPTTPLATAPPPQKTTEGQQGQPQVVTQQPKTPTQTPQEATKADMTKKASAGQFFSQAGDFLKKEILGIAAAGGDASKKAPGESGKTVTKTPEAAAPAPAGTAYRPAPTLESMPAGTGQFDQDRIPYAPINQPNQTSDTGARPEPIDQTARRALLGDRNAAEALAGNNPQSIIQNAAANRAAAVSSLANPNWRPTQNPVNETVDRAANEAARGIRSVVAPKHFVANPPIAGTVPTPTAATDTQSAVQNVTTARAAQVNNPPTSTPATLWNIGTGLLSPAGPAGNIQGGQGGERLQQQAPGILRRLVLPFGPSYDEEQKFQQQQEQEQQERYRKELEGQQPVDAAVGAPLGAPDNAPGAFQAMRLHHQAHVDSLAPGTPFYWRDHPGAYVKV